nr:hypothetical protein [Propionicimonas sp.]
MAVPQPTAADVQAYLEFLAERHPQLLDALERVAEALVAEGVDLRRLAHPDAGDPPLVITPPSE